MRKLTEANLKVCRQLIDEKQAKDRADKERKLTAKQTSDTEVTIAHDRPKPGTVSAFG